MSRIFRSRDLPPERLSELSLDDKRVRDPRLRRPLGGIKGVVPGNGEPGSLLSGHERKQFEARSILETARAEAERIQQEAYHKGFEQGEQAGMKLASQKVDSVLKELQTLIGALAGERQRLVEQHESELVRIAFAIAMKILHREIEENGDAVMGVVREAMKKVNKADHVRVKLSPYDLELIQQQMHSSGQGMDWLTPEVELEGDFEISRGGCRIQTDTGEVDATIETQIEMLKSLLWNG